jgi:hypothetical protein
MEAGEIMGSARFNTPYMAVWHGKGKHEMDKFSPEKPGFPQLRRGLSTG